MTATFEQAKRQTERVTGVSNVAYDLMVVLTNKLQGIAALEEYKLDADAAGDHDVRTVLDRIEQHDRQDVDELRDLVCQRLQRPQRR
ncbi:MAG TPA: hypothetical protein VKB09_06810 [Thermomicrobiales bacterium]|nr:hypothetical protein [Thermomicrobiales bacterium]